MVQELGPGQRESELTMYQGGYTISTGGRGGAMNFLSQNDKIQRP